MYKTKAKLVIFFGEMLEEVGKFNKNTYDDIFFTALKKHESLFKDMETLLEEAEEDSRKNLIEELSLVLPDYVKSIMNSLDKKQKNKIEMNYNLNMAIYIIPAITYSKNVYLDKIAERTVALWNEKKVTSLTLKLSTYDDIDKGFKKKLCYITTAVCENQNKPDDCYELSTLRDYRDNYLMKSDAGCELVEEYYNIAPGLVMMIDMQKNSKDIYQNIYYKYLMPCIRYIEENRNEECCELYMQMVNVLKNHYLYS